MTALAALLGAGVGLGVWRLLRGCTTGSGPEAVSRLAVRRPFRQPGAGRRALRRAVAPVAVGVGIGAITGWIVGGVLAAAAVWALPRVLGPDREQAARVARFEAIAGWAEMLRDTLSAAAGLEQAIIATAPLSADAIRGPLTAAADQLRAGQRLAPVLRVLADKLADPTADLVIGALLLAAERRAGNLAELLGSLAHAAREHAALRMSIQAARAQTRSEVRITVGTTVAFATGLVLLDRRYLDAYDSTAGQLMLLLVGALFAAGFWALARIARLPEPARFLNATPATAPILPGRVGESR